MHVPTAKELRMLAREVQQGGRCKHKELRGCSVLQEDELRTLRRLKPKELRAELAQATRAQPRTRRPTLPPRAMPPAPSG